MTEQNDTQQTDSPLLLAVPAKGRLAEPTADLFQAAGMALQRLGTRGYHGTLAGMDNVKIIYLSAGEIVTRLQDGSIHLGITGEDLLRENIPDMESRIYLIDRLGFGRADVVVAVSDSWLDVVSMEDLAEVALEFRKQQGRHMRVASKYRNLTADFFAAHDLADYQIVTSLGATEGAPASGMAELIVDITSTGATLEANGLRILSDGIILRSQTNLAASLSADWTRQACQAARQILARLDARKTATHIRQLRLSLERPQAENTPPLAIIRRFADDYAAEYEARPLAYNHDPKADGTNRNADGIFLVPEDKLQALIDVWLAAGDKAGDKSRQAIVTKPDYVFSTDSERQLPYRQLMARIEQITGQAGS